MVACTKYCVDVCPEIARASIAIVSDSWSAQVQQIVSAQPDLVIASVPYQPEAVGEILKAGVRFLGLAPQTLADIYADIAAIAGVMGAGERSEALIGNMQAHIDTVRQRVTARPKLRAFCEAWGKPIIASQPWVTELIAAAGGAIVGDPGKTTTAEDVAASDPDVILAAWCGALCAASLPGPACQPAWPATSGSDAAWDEITGTPTDIASSGGKPNPSYLDGNTNNRAAR